MLKNLVKKFKTHSLNEDSDEAMTSSQQQQHGMVTRTGSLLKNNTTTVVAPPGGNAVCIKCPVDLELDKDSGTESDEELERIETNSTHSVPVSQTSDYYASQQSLSASCRSSHCGSPGAFSDQEFNSWDNAAIDSASFFETPDLPNHHYHTRQQFQRFLKQHQLNTGPPLPADNATQISMMKNGILDSRLLPDQQQPPFLSPYHQRYKKPSFANSDSSGYGNSISPCSPCSNVYTKRALTFPPTATAEKSTGDNEKLIKTAFSPVRRLRSEPSARALSNEIVAEVDETVSEHAGEADDNDNSNSGSSTFSSSNSSISDSSTNNRVRSCSLTTTTLEKRKWSQVRNSSGVQNYANFLANNFGYKSNSTNYGSGNNNFLKNQVLPAFSFSATSNDANFSNQTKPATDPPQAAVRPLLTAARKTPVKFLIPPNGMTSSAARPDWSLEAAPTNRDEEADEDEDDCSATCPESAKYSLRVGTQATAANKISPRKKYRHDDDEAEDRNNFNGQQGADRRPSLNFDKMRGKLVSGPSSKKKCQFLNNVQTKLKTRGCSNAGYQLRSSRSDCLFRPVHQLNDIFAANGSITSSTNLHITTPTPPDDVTVAPTAGNE